MGKCVVVYKSKYGSAEKYAKWISEELKADIYKEGEISLDKLKEYSTIIYGGGIYAGGVLGLSLITKNFQSIKEKNLIVFTVGLADPKNKEQFIPLINNSFTEEMKKSIKLFHLRGGINYKKLNFMHRSMMKLLKVKVSKIPEVERDDETKQMLDTYGKEVDFTDIKSIKPLVNLCNNLYNK